MFEPPQAGGAVGSEVVRLTVGLAVALAVGFAVGLVVGLYVPSKASASCSRILPRTVAAAGCYHDNHAVKHVT